MGRNKELNRLRKRTRSDGAAGGKNREALNGKSGRTAGGNEVNDKRPRGTLGRLWALVYNYPFLGASVHDEKQVLILGTIGSGTSRTSTGLRRLGMEVGFEASDSSRELCRDGTVSWVHAIRFLSGRPNLALLCARPRYRVFHSTMIQPSEKCGRLFNSWEGCWAEECRTVISKEFGCALREAGDGEEDVVDETDDGTGLGLRNRQCSTPFRKTLLQVRHPLDTVAYLAAKSASPEGTVGVDCGNARNQLATVTSLFPSKVIQQHLGDPHRGSTSTIVGSTDAYSSFEWGNASSTCVETWAWYWVVYNAAALAGGVEDWYRVEETPPAQVAVLAGLTGKKIDEALAVGEGSQGSGHGNSRETDSYEQGLPMAPEGFEVTWEDIASYPGGLLREMSDLAVKLGYEGAPGLPPLPNKSEEVAGEREAGGRVEDTIVDATTEQEKKPKRRGWRRIFGVLRRLGRKKGG